MPDLRAVLLRTERPSAPWWRRGAAAGSPGASDTADLEVPNLDDPWGEAARRAGNHALMVAGPLVLGWLLVTEWRDRAMAFDVRYAYLSGARAVLAGHSPFPPVTVAALRPGTAFVYPPLSAYLFAPLAGLPDLAAEALVTVLCVACVFVILRVLDVRDPRCYAIALLWLPTCTAIQNANVSLPIAAGLALLWRWRSRPIVAGVLIGFLVALKLFLWPLFIWFLATRRFRAAAAGAGASILFVFVPWAVLGFAGLTEYPHLLNLLSQVERSQSYSLAALLARSVSWRLAGPVGIAAGLAVLAGAWGAGRRSDRVSFTLAIAAVLALSPIVWMHYFVFLLVVLAVLKPRFSWLWALPLLLWAAPAHGNGASWQTALALLVVAMTFALALLPRIATVSVRRETDGLLRPSVTT